MKNQSVPSKRQSSDEMQLKVLTLNCWGLRFVSRQRPVRIKAIAQHIQEQNYDIVFLQELWCQPDFDLIKKATGYKFAHYFKTSSIAGTSGLAIFAKWAPDTLHFEPFTVNGSPFSPHHGDWFAGKGVAYARIDMNELRLHLFCTHLHAQYDDKEKITDMYAIHRLCQSYQLAKIINLVTATAVNVKEGKDLIVLAGDLNTSPGEPPFKLLMSMTGLLDCCMHRYSHDVKMTLHGIEGTQVDDDLITCGHHLNSFSVTSTHKTVVTNDTEQLMRPSGKRIDFVLCKLVQECQRNSSVSLSGFNHSFNATKLHCDGKDPQSGISFSDHQPVSVQLSIKLGHFMVLDQNDAGDNPLSKLPLQALINYKNGTFFSDKREGDHRNGYKKCASDFHDLSVNEIGVEDVEYETIASNAVKKLECNMLLDMLPRQRSSSVTESKTVSKVHFTKEDLASKFDDPSWNQLGNCERLLSEYLDKNHSLKQKKNISVILMMIFSLCLAFVVAHFTDLTALTLIQIWCFVIAYGLFWLLAIESADRFEKTAVKAILEEISCLLSFCPRRNN